METLIKEKVCEFTIDVSNAKKVINLGSDEHLDLINVHRKPIVLITVLLSKLNKSLSGFYNTETFITANDLKLLSEVNTLNSKIYAAKKKSKFYPDFKEALEQFNDERLITKEIIHDFKEFRVKSEGLKKLNKRLKTL